MRTLLLLLLLANICFPPVSTIDSIKFGAKPPDLAHDGTGVFHSLDDKKKQFDVRSFSISVKLKISKPPLFLAPQIKLKL
jgi:hypothetical protein